MLVPSRSSVRDRSADNLLRGLIIFEVLLVVFHWVDALLGAPVPLLHGLFDLDGEANIPTWFSSAQLLVIGLVLLIAALHNGSTGKPSRLLLCCLSAGFVLVSADEVVQLHEGITGVLGARYIDWAPSLANEYRGTSILAAVALMIVLRNLYPNMVAFWKWSRKLSLMALAGFSMMILGASVIESIGYKFMQPGSIAYSVEVSVEELLEMVGASLILRSAVLFAKDRVESPSKDGSLSISMAHLS
jgi:hypothetical protein